MTEKKDSAVDSSMNVLNAAIVDLARRGIVDTTIVASLAEIAIKTTRADREHAQMHLDALAAITKAAADAHRAGTAMNLAQAIFGNA